MLLILLSGVSGSVAQVTLINGVVTDAKTRERLPYVSVSFVGGPQGVNSDKEGKFRIAAKESYSMVKVSYVGYKTVIKQIEAGKNSY